MSHTVLHLPNLSTLTRAGEIAVRVTLVSIVLTLCAAVLPASAQALIQHYQLNIPRQPLDTALKDFAHQTGLQIARFSDTVNGNAMVGPISGNLSVEQALKSLLDPTGLSFKMVNDRTVAIVRSGSDSPPVSGNSSLSDSKPRDRLHLAQTTQGSTSGTATVDDSTRESRANSPPTLQEITVTASRRSELLKDVPSSVTAIGQAQLDNLVASRFDDFVGQIPNISFAGNGRGNRMIILRGISTSSNDQNATVATYIDDVSVGSSTSSAVGSRFVPDVDAFDLNRIEVLRGPQGTLYGANSLGGLLKYVTTAPNTDRLELYGRSSGSATAHGGGGYSVNGGANLPISDTMALRISGFDTKEGGWIDDLATGENNVNDLRTYGGRAALLFKPTDHLTLKASAIYQHYRTGGESTADISNISTGALTYGPFEQFRSTPEPQTMNFQLYSLSVDGDLGFGNLISSTAYTIGDTDRTRDYTRQWAGMLPGIPFYQNALSVGTRRFTEEIKLVSVANHELEWIVGTYYTHEDSDALTIIDGQTSPGTVGPGLAGNMFQDDLVSTYNQIAGYGDMTVYLGDRFDITGGLRITHDQVKVVDSGGGFVNGGPYVDTPAPNTDNATTFLVTPRLHLSSNTMIYGRVASGFRPGGPNDVSPAAIAAGATPGFKSDNLTNYEVGIKTSALNNRVTLDASIFDIDWRDIQIRTSSGGFFYIGNAGKASSKGAELTVGALPIDNLSVSLNFGYTDAKLTEAAPAIGGSAGDRLPNAPKFTVGGMVDYSFDLVGTMRGDVGASYRFVGDRLADFNRNFAPRYDMGGYGTVDLRTGVKFDHYEVGLFARNVTDTRGVESASTNFTPSNITISRPRTIGIAITARY
jgi:iron complex outermembrane receptor protein